MNIFKYIELVLDYDKYIFDRKRLSVIKKKKTTKQIPLTWSAKYNQVNKQNHKKTHIQKNN